MTDQEIFKVKCMTYEWRYEFSKKWREIQKMFENGVIKNDYAGNQKRSK